MLGRLTLGAGLLLPSVATAAETAEHGGPWSLLGPLVAIGLALVTRKVVPSLVAGALLASIVAAEFDVLGGIGVAVGHLLSALLGDYTEKPVLEALFTHDNSKITLFSLGVAAMVGVIYKAGATRDLVRKVEKVAKGRRGAVVASWLSGAIVFFDDYANCLVVGGAMGPLYDRHKVSRAKLAYVVDSTAAPVASLAVVSTWVGFEVGLIAEGLEGTGVAMTAFALFLAALPFRFYAIYTLAFVGGVASTGRDFGPMWEAECEALSLPHREEVHEAQTGESRWWVAAAAVGALVSVTFAYLYIKGSEALGPELSGARLFEIIGGADPYNAMLWGSGTGLGLAILLSVLSRGLAPKEVGPAVWGGIQPVFEALVVLYLAWTLGGAVKDTGAAQFLSENLTSTLPIAALPTVAFLLAAGTAFATGTSFGTMSILLPTVVEISVAADPTLGPVALGSIAAVLAGSCLGDHASPISDTTVLSALGAGVDVITHVRTQLPYALTTGAISIFVGYVPAGFGYSPWLCLPVGIVTALAIIRFIGRPAEARTPAVYPESA
ncbi:MAG: Na+/H+ antiporter NhaC family protein [Proteobacteria bacterium]|nr:Na+/H+ antiporter NhaC family protein [Pseudomonadota bacterium]